MHARRSRDSYIVAMIVNVNCAHKINRKSFKEESKWTSVGLAQPHLARNQNSLKPFQKLKPRHRDWKSLCGPIAAIRTPPRSNSTIERLTIMAGTLSVVGFQCNGPLRLTSSQAREVGSSECGIWPHLRDFCLAMSSFLKTDPTNRRVTTSHFLQVHSRRFSRILCYPRDPRSHQQPLVISK